MESLENITEYKWSTDYYHHDNTFTMNDFIENHLTDNYEVIFNDGSYCEVQCVNTDKIYSLNAKGDGDCYNHIVEINLIS